MERRTRICKDAGPVLPNILKNVKNSFGLVFEVLPNFMSIGLVALILADYTPVFDWLGYIFYPITLLLQNPEPLLAAKAAFSPGGNVPSVPGRRMRRS